jgi:hypothetical protein
MKLCLEHLRIFLFNLFKWITQKNNSTVTSLTFYNKLKVSITSSTACSVSSEGKQTSFLIQVDFLFEIDESHKKVEEKYQRHKAKFMADKEREEKRKLKEEQLKKENLKRLTPSVKEISAEEAERLKRQEQMESQPSSNTTQSTTINASTQQTPTVTETKVENKPKEEEKKEEYKGEKPNSGNGGSSSRYIWSQKLEAVQLDIPVDQRYRGKDLDIKYKSKSLFVGIKNGETIIDGEFPHPIKVIN